jgi:hypothetical protein
MEIANTLQCIICHSFHDREISFTRRVDSAGASAVQMEELMGEEEAEEDSSDEEDENGAPHVVQLKLAQKKLLASTAANGMAKGKGKQNNGKGAEHSKKSKAQAAKDLESDESEDEEEESDDDEDADPSAVAVAVTKARQHQEKIERQKQKESLSGSQQTKEAGTCLTLPLSMLLAVFCALVHAAEAYMSALYQVTFL